MTVLTGKQAAATVSATERVAAVQQTFERCGQSFCRYFAVRTTGDPDLADDLMQQLWLRARLSAEDLRETNPEPWLWRIARNLLHEHWRKRARTRAMAVADPMVARALAERMDTEELPDEMLSRQEVQAQVLLALTELPSDDQELLVGFYFESRSQAELAARLNISERAVEGRMYRARSALRDTLVHLAI